MNTTGPVQCPTCRGIQQTELGATGYTCALCGSEWQWAVCQACDGLELALSGQESWRCGKCARYTRSWWHTSSLGQDAALIQRRREHERAALNQARRAGPGRRRRRALVAVGSTLVLATGSLAIGLGGGATPAEQTRIACARFDDVRSKVSNGAVDRGQLATELAAIRDRAAQGSAPVAVAAKRLEVAAEPGTSAFLVAQTQLARACGGGSAA